jgi:hypothetical protein
MEMIMPGIHHSRTPFLIAALLACTSCGQGAQGAAQEAAPAVYGAAQDSVAPDIPKARKENAKEKDKASASLGDRVLAYPDDLQVTMLAYRVTDRVPPLEDWAADKYEVRRADEFSKAQMLQEEAARLAAVYETTENVGYLQYRLNSQLSQYDSTKGGYYLTSFSPGQQTTFSGREQISVQLENIKDAYFWALPADAAREILAQTSRNVSIDVKVRITGTERRSSGLLIKGRIIDYSIYSKRYNDELLFAQFSLE